MHEDGKASQRSFGFGSGREALQRGPHRVLDVRRDLETFIREQARHPVEGKRDLARLIDSRQRLEGECAFKPQLDRGAVHGKCCGPRRASTVEDCDLGADEAAELEGEHRQQHRLAGTRWAHD